jgi:hypothetical protein
VAPEGQRCGGDGRSLSPTATTLKATFTSGKLKLGAATVKLRAGQAAQLTTKLSAAVRRALKGKKKLKVTVKAGGTTRTVTFTVA